MAIGAEVSNESCDPSALTARTFCFVNQIVIVLLEFRFANDLRAPAEGAERPDETGSTSAVAMRAIDFIQINDCFSPRINDANNGSSYSGVRFFLKAPRCQLG